MRYGENLVIDASKYVLSSNKQKLFLYKLLTILVVIAFPFVSFSQNKIDINKKITVVAENKKLSEVLDIISRTGGYDISYSNEQIPVDKVITVRQINKSLHKVLTQVCNTSDLYYSLVENNIIIKSKSVKEEESVSVKPQVTKYTISGYVKDSESGEVLIGTTVYDTVSLLGTTTNAYGFYSITLPEGKYNIKFSFMGYKSKKIELILNKNIWNSVDLDINNSVLQAVVVKSEDEAATLNLDPLGHAKIQPKSLQFAPSFSGDIDFIKSMQYFPGIKSHGDGSSLFYVRGGDKDQNLILLDEAPIYNPSHLFGFFSTFSMDAIKDIAIYKGDIPANYGGKLSSVIDIHTKDGSLTEHSFYGNMNLFTNSYTLEGPIWKEKASIILSYRRSHLNWLFKEDNPEQNIYFWDFNSKANIIINKNNRLYFTFYSGKDYFGDLSSGTGDFAVTWGNSAGTFRWNHIFNNKLFSNLTVYSSLYEYYLFTSLRDDIYWKSEIHNFSIKSDFTYYISPKNILKYGVLLNTHNIDPGNYYFGELEEYVEVPKIPIRKVNETTFYFSNQQSIAKRWKVNFGLRIPIWSNLGPTKIYSFDDDFNIIDTIKYESNKTFHSYSFLEPRITITYNANENNSCRFSYTRTGQYLNLLSNSISPFTSIEHWLPSGPNIKPQFSDQFILGYSHFFTNKTFEFSADTYAKFLKNQIEFTDHPKLLLNPFIESELRIGESRSYGIELLLKKNTGKTSGWLSYTYSRALEKNPYIDEGSTFPAYQDRPHDFSIFFSHAFTRRFIFTANWLYYTGSAITTPTSYFYYQNYTVPVYATKNNDRLPDYHRLDVATTFILNKKERFYKHSLTLSLYNAYNQRNPVAINFNKTELDDDSIKIPADMYNSPKLYTTSLSLLGIIPSIKYSFKLN